MTQATFVAKRKVLWTHLDALLVRAARTGARRIDAQDIESIGRLYRAVTSDLAYARGRRYDSRLLAYLNRLAARAHAYIYGADASTGKARILQFYAQTFPREFRRSLVAILACCALTIACAVVGYVVIRTHPADAFALLPAQVVPAEIRKSLHDSNFAFDPANSPLMSTAIITNNIKVAVLAFAGCVTLGVFTVWIVLQNGLMLGGLAALFTNAGFGADFWATIAPHGVIELTAIQIAAAAGLTLAAGIVAPGSLRRRDAIAQNARRAGVLIAGVASMLAVAGTIEGFFSPLRLPAADRIAFGAVTAIALAGYFAFAGRERTAQTSAEY
ncbi:MAG: stage II sporulation protein M [Candidatus Eremiobacteraeota bacterium]|nr:stage II sporulation protein M [Candidatus Eremiobacteraeota bacterium]